YKAAEGLLEGLFSGLVRNISSIGVVEEFILFREFIWLHAHNLVTVWPSAFNFSTQMAKCKTEMEDID
ncbi:hypothetical protein BDN72DRAFT_835022, partial [Pluteus cervinus]